jgi:hypothetical protein
VKHFLSFYLQQIQITIKTWFVFGYGIIGLHTSIPSEENTDKHKDLQKKKNTLRCILFRCGTLLGYSETTLKNQRIHHFISGKTVSTIITSHYKLFLTLISYTVSMVH